MLENKSVKEIISLVNKKKISVKEVVSFYLDRIKKFNSSLNAIVSIKDEEEIFSIGDKLSVPLREARENFEKEYLSSQLKKFGGNVSKMAKFSRTINKLRVGL